MEINKKTKLRVVWKDTLENITKTNKNKILDKLVNTYNIPKKSIRIDTYAVTNELKDCEIIDDTFIDDVMKPDYQYKLIEEYGKLKGIKIDMSSIKKIDTEVNDIIINEYEDTRFKSWYVNKLGFSNFLSYGENNIVDYRKLQGVTIVNGVSPYKNQAGKSTINDALMFLLFGQTTKTEKLSEVFNKHTDKNKVNVFGEIVINSQTYIIERNLTRKLKKNGLDYNYKNEVNYYLIDSDNNKVNLEGEQRAETEKIITKYVGTKNDFLMTVLATEANLEDLINTRATERSKLFNRYIGIEILEEKKEVAKNILAEKNKSFKKNHYDRDLLLEENDELINNIAQDTAELEDLDKKVNELENEIIELDSKIEKNLSNIKDVDKELNNINYNSLLNDIDDLKNKANKVKTNITKLESEIDQIDVEFTENDKSSLKNLRNIKEGFTKDITVKNIEISNIEKNISNLEDSKVCNTCGSVLKDIDPKIITEYKNQVDLIKKEIITITNNLNDTVTEINLLEEKNELSSELYKKKFNLEKLKSDGKLMKTKYNELVNKKAKYNEQKSLMEENKKIESYILGFKQKKTNINYELKNIREEIQEIKIDVDANKLKLETNKDIIKSINEELIIEANYNNYITTMGKDGISKMILKNIIPKINIEISRLLDDTCDFDLNLKFNEKKGVDFIFIKDGVEKNIYFGSGYEKTLCSLVIRVILNKISTLPKSNVIILDEILGKVSKENLQIFEVIIDRIKDYFSNIFIISHDEEIKDWGDNSITIVKQNNISKLV